MENDSKIFLISNCLKMDLKKIKSGRENEAQKNWHKKPKKGWAGLPITAIVAGKLL